QGGAVVVAAGAALPAGVQPGGGGGGAGVDGRAAGQQGERRGRPAVVGQSRQQRVAAEKAAGCGRDGAVLLHVGGAWPEVVAAAAGVPRGGAVLLVVDRVALGAAAAGAAGEDVVDQGQGRTRAGAVADEAGVVAPWGDQRQVVDGAPAGVSALAAG